MKKIIIHDYAGHPFTYDLACELATKNNFVHYIYTTSSGGPKANFSDDIDNLKIFNIDTKKIEKSNFFKRYFQEIDYSKNLISQIDSIQADNIISANTPLSVQSSLLKWSKKNNVKFIFWLQDIISIAAKSILGNKFGLFGRFISYFMYLQEKSILKKSDSIICICEDFVKILKSWNVKNTTYMIPNWSPISQISVKSKINEWSKKHSLTNSFNVVYSGTMGMKHNPDVLLYAAEKLKNENITFTIISEGTGFEFLKNSIKSLSVNNIKLFDLQPFSKIPDILASGDLLLVLLDKSAGEYSVPSKLWSYYCAKRCCILHVPKNNLTAKITMQNNCGVVSDSKEDFVSKILMLKNDSNKLNHMGENARKYAEKYFNINEISNKFISIIK